MQVEILKKSSRYSLCCRKSEADFGDNTNRYRQKFSKDHFATHSTIRNAHKVGFENFYLYLLSLSHDLSMQVEILKKSPRYSLYSYQVTSLFTLLISWSWFCYSLYSSICSWLWQCHFWDNAKRCRQKFSKFISLLTLLYKINMKLTFENFHLYLLSLSHDLSMQVKLLKKSSCYSLYYRKRIWSCHLRISTCHCLTILACR